MKYPSLPRFFPKTFDHSAMKYFKECHRKFMYRIILGRVPPKSKYQVIFDFGKAYHSFREILELEHMAGKPEQECYMTALTKTLDMPLTKGEGKYEYYTKQRLAQTCKVAFEHWQKEKKQGAIEVISVEQPFNVELAPGHYISGRADQIIKLNGQVWGRDFKTTSKMLQFFTATLDPNDQAVRYMFMESKLVFGAEAVDNGKMIKGIIFEVMQNTKTTEPKISPVLITKNKQQLQIWRDEQLFLDELLTLCNERDIWAMHESNCSFCDYAKVCKAPSETSQENILRNEFNLSPWNHELVEQVTLSES